MVTERRVDALILTASNTLIKGSIPWRLVERIFIIGIPITPGEKISIKPAAEDRELILSEHVLIRIPMNMVHWQDN